MTEPTGQILPESNFGRVLTRLAMNSNTIVEIGCWRGGGSTKCLADGLVRPEQRMWSIDVSPQMIAEARERNPDERITFLCGTVLKPEECDPMNHGLYGDGSGHRTKALLPEDHRLGDAMEEMRRTAQCPCVCDQLSEQIDLCLCDGGEYSTRFDFLKLYKRCRVIALDDIRRDCSWKNYRNHQSLMSPLHPTTAFNLMFHRPYERHGWSVFMRVPKRPNGKLFPICRSLDDIDRVLNPPK